MSQNQRERAVAKLYDEMRRTGKTGELLRSIGTMNSYKQFSDPEKSSVLKRAATTAAGAYAGAALGKADV